MARVELRGTAEFRDLAQRLKAAGEGKIARELNKALKKSAGPIVNQARENVRGLDVEGEGAGGGESGAQRPAPSPTRRGGSSARTARYRKALGKKKRVTDTRKLAIYRKSSGLRDTVANAVSAKTSVTARSASLRVRAARSKMPDDQRKLPKYLNDGRWRHPVFANDDAWVWQYAPPAWFDDAGRKRSPEAADNAIAVVAEFTNKIL